MLEPTQTLNIEQLTTDEVLDRLVQVRQALATLQATDDALLDRLDDLVAAGEIDAGGFSHNDWLFSWSAGRDAWAYPAVVQGLQAQVKAAKKTAKADGSAVATTGNPFWTINRPKKP